MHRDLQPLPLRAEECGRECRYIADAGVAAQVDAHDAMWAVSECEVHDFFRFGGDVAAVDGEDEVCVEGFGRIGAVLSDAGEDGADVGGFCDAGVGDGAGGCAEFEIDDVVRLEVSEDGGGCVSEVLVRSCGF